MEKKNEISLKRFFLSIFIILFVLILCASVLIFFKVKSNLKNLEELKYWDVTEQSPIDYNKKILQENDENVKIDYKKRKEKYGLKDEIDLIATPEETLKIGDSKLSMQKILDNTKLSTGEVLEKDIIGDRKIILNKFEEYGIYIVKPGDNIWNIHFELIKNYYKHKGISVSSLADEPQKKKSSSGIGKLLKFSEKMVTIYNIKKHKVEFEIHLIQPLSKIIIYNMGKVYNLLEQIDYSEVDRILFDGDTIWLPTK